MTRIRLTDAEAAHSLIRHLDDQSDVVAELVSSQEIELNVLGSFGREPMRLEIFLRIRAWEAAERTHGRRVGAEIVD